MRLDTKDPVRVGVLGGANIARQFARDVSSSALVKVVAVASTTRHFPQALRF